MLAKKEKKKKSSVYYFHHSANSFSAYTEVHFKLEGKKKLILFLKRLGHLYIQYILIIIKPLNGKESEKCQLVFH